MKWVWILTFILVFATSLALNINYSEYLGTDWQFKVVPVANGNGLVTRELGIDNNTGVYFHVHSDDHFNGIWRLWKVIPHPPANDFYISFKVKIHAPDIDLDYGNKGNAEGEAQANDGPNIFTLLYYGSGNTSLDNPGFNPSSISWFGVNGDMCHIHLECNYLGPENMYCSSETVYKGWLFDGNSLSDSNAVNKYNEEPIEQDKWKTVVMHIRDGECMHDYLALVIMANDFEGNKEFDWEISQVKIYTEDESISYTIPLDNIFDQERNEYISPPSYCGDGKKDTPNALGQNEECDGNDGVPDGFVCTSDCKLEPVCGDGKVVDGEVCDGNNVTKGFKCSSDCKSMQPICGDGIVVEGELCDGENVTKGFKCSSDCKSMQPICGDGIVAGIEECDGNTGIKPGFVCVNCHLVKDLGDGRKLIDNVLSKDIPENGSEIVEFTSDSHLVLNEEDILAYLKARGTSRLIKICSIAQCESSYVPLGGKLEINPGTNYVKVYNKNGTYYLGVKAGQGGMGEETLLLIVMVIGFLVLLAVLVILGIVIYFNFYKKKKGKIRLR